MVGSFILVCFLFGALSILYGRYKKARRRYSRTIILLIMLLLGYFTGIVFLQFLSGLQIVNVELTTFTGLYVLFAICLIIWQILQNKKYKKAQIQTRQS